MSFPCHTLVFFATGQLSKMMDAQVATQLYIAAFVIQHSKNGAYPFRNILTVCLNLGSYTVASYVHITGSYVAISFFLLPACHFQFSFLKWFRGIAPLRNTVLCIVTPVIVVLFYACGDNIVITAMIEVYAILYCNSFLKVSSFCVGQHV